MPENTQEGKGGAKSWQFWTVILVVLIIAAAALAVNRYTFRCTATHPGGAATDRVQSVVKCHILDRWTGEVRTMRGGQ